MIKQQNYDWLVNLVVIGDSGVGKTNFLLRFCESSFEPSHISTQGAELKTKYIDVDGKKIKMEIWDTSGREIFKQITTNYYKGAIGFFLMYSVNDKDSFQNIKNWMNTIKQYANENVFIMLIGNKIDESIRQVTKDEGEALAKQFEIPFFETSAKEGTEIANAFQATLKQVSQNEQTQQKQQQRQLNFQQEEFQIQEIEQNQKTYELFKVLMIGDSGVGKTNILLRFSENSFSPQYNSTIGVDFKIRTIEDDEGKQIKMQIWNTAGQERFRTITQSFYRGANAIMLIYSVDDKESFNNITYWMNSVKHNVNEKVCLVLIGNKIDQSRREVSLEEDFCQKGNTVANAFYKMAQLLKSNHLNKEICQQQQTQNITQTSVSKQQENVEVKQIKQEEKAFELLKALIIGDAGVGKTNILLRFCENSFQPNYISTIGIDFKIKSIEEEGKIIKMQIWDTSGQERFRTITQGYYKGVMAIMLVYSVDDKASFSNIKNWLNQVQLHASQTYSLVLIGNKVDVQKREVTFEEGQNQAQQFGIPFFETSAMDGTNVADAFIATAKLKNLNPQKEEITQIKQTKQIDQKPEIKDSEIAEVQQTKQKDEAYQLFRILIIGDAGVGKTNILQRFCDDSFSTSYISTIGVDFRFKTIQVEGKQIKMQIWDTAGQERFQAITQSYYRGATAIMLVYSVDDKESFNNITYWMNSAKHNVNEKVCLVLIGNKIDQSRREVPLEEGQELANKFGMLFFEISAKEGTTVANAFYKMAQSLKFNHLNKETCQQQQTQNITQTPVSQQQEEIAVQKIKQEEKAYEYLKVVIIGDAGVGKTNILLRFCENSFQPYYISTIGIDFKMKIISEDGRIIKTQVWDTSGQQRFMTITQSYYRGATAIMLVYSVNDKYSFNNISYWMNTIKQHASENVRLMLIGDQAEGKALSLQFGIPFFETSAKEGTNVADAFLAMANSKKVNLQKGEMTQTQQTQEIDQKQVSEQQEEIQIEQADKNQEVYETYKALIIGDSGVGKTNIMLRFCENSFQSSPYSKINVNYKKKIIINEDMKIGMEIWDTSWEERFRTIMNENYKGAGIILVYSVDDRQTFQNIKNLMNQVQHASRNISALIMGNKADVTKREVTLEGGQDLAKQFRIQFFETSAKEGTNVTESFFAIAKTLRINLQKEQTQQIEQIPVSEQIVEVEAQKIKLEQEFIKTFKTLIIGDAGVGKTNILLRFCENSFSPQYNSTIGVDFKIKTIDEMGKKIKILIFDASGQERFTPIMQTYYKGAKAIILVYQVDDMQTFNNIENWMNQIEKHGSENVCKLLIGNKIDTSERQVLRKEKSQPNSLESHFLRPPPRLEPILQMLLEQWLNQ